jgi:hypothetical protein
MEDLVDEAAPAQVVPLNEFSTAVNAWIGDIC